jgi:hypothetical protein
MPHYPDDNLGREAILALIRAIRAFNAGDNAWGEQQLDEAEKHALNIDYPGEHGGVPS